MPALAPLRHHRFRLLVGGQLTSNIGDACYAVALPWYVLASHRGVLLLGIALGAYGIPRAALISVGGWAADNFSPTKVMLTADATRVVVISALALTAAFTPASAAALIPIAITAGAAEGLFLPGSLSIVPSLLPTEDLQSGNALVSSGTQLSTMIGPAIGGAIVAATGSVLAFALDAGSFAVSALTLTLMATATLRLARAAAKRQPTTGEPQTVSEPATTTAPPLLTFLRDNSVFWVLMVISLAANLGIGGMSQIALPDLAYGPLHAGADGYGAILAAFGLGALAGALAAAQLPTLRHPALAASILFLIQAPIIAAIPFALSTFIAATLLAAFGAFNGFANVVTLTAFQRWVPPQMIGRLTSMVLLMGYGVFPVSVLAAGAMIHSLGVASFFLLTAATLVAAVIGGLTQRSWRVFGALSDTATADDPEDPVSA